MINRAIRLLPNLVAFYIIYTVYKNTSHKYILIFLFCIFISSICAFFYERPIFTVLSLSFNFLGYLSLGLALIPKLSKIKAGWFLKVYFFIALGFIAYTLIDLNQLSKPYLESIPYILMNLNSLGLVFILGSSLLFVHQSPNSISLLFLLAVIIFILSEITRAVNYYSVEKVYLFFYACRFFYILSLSFIIYCCGLVEVSCLKTKK